MRKKQRRKIKNEEDELPKALRKNKKTENKQEFSKVKKNKMKKPKVKTIIFILVFLAIIIFGIKTAISVNSFKNIILEMAKNENSVVKDTSGNIIATIGEEKIKTTVSSNEIPDNLKNAYVAIEDERYYKHGGIDVKRTGGAIFSYIFKRGSSYGGSTITQQLVKNLTGDNSTTISRKVKEWGKAIVIDSTMSKDEILGLYLNVIYVGPNIYGVETGAEYYFNKSVENLSLEECAFLAGINNSPNSYNPFGTDDVTEKIKNRTKTVLAKMEELGYISEDEYNTAVANVDEGLNFKKGSVTKGDAIYSYHTDALLSELISDLEDKKNMTETFATNYLEMAGLQINSTQDSSVQEEIETEFEKSKYVLASNTGGDSSQAAMVIIDQSTGYVTGCVGGLGEKTTSRGFNRATQSVRQTGSSIKPIAVLVPGIAKRKFTASTIFNDEQTEFADGYSPEDYSDYLGDITVRRALESSQNIPFVRMMQQIGTSTSMKYLKKMGITTLTEEDNNLTLALGGLEKGISPLQMAAAYATIANDGVYIEPTFYTEVVNSNGETVIKSKQKKRRVCSKQVAYIVKELLTEPVNGENGTAQYCKIAGMDVAAKTGTTDKNYDRWLCGFTPYYTAVTWYGYDQNESINFGGKKNPAGIIWSNVMSRVHKSLNNASFEKPSFIFEETICAETGMKANSGCTDTYTEYYLFGTVPTTCTTHSKTSSGSSSTNSTKKTTTNSFDTTTLDDIDNPVVTTNTTQETNTNVNNNTTNVTNTTTYNQNKNTKQTNTTSTNTNSTTTNTTTKDSITNESTKKTTNTTSGNFINSVE